MRLCVHVGGVGVVSKQRVLTEAEYMKPQWTKMPDASKHHVFVTYRAYCRHRDDTGAWDVGQRNLALYRRLRRRPREAWRDGQCPFGHVSVDEVQDVTAVELALVLLACGNQPQQLSLFGDTTQQVTPGCVFPDRMKVALDNLGVDMHPPCVRGARARTHTHTHTHT